jgi:hypothetical protein
MADVRDPVRVGFDGDGVTSPLSRAATGTDVRAAARVLQAGGPTVGPPRLPAETIVGGGVLAALLIGLVVSVIWVSNSSKHSLVQPIPSTPSTTAAPTATAGPTVAYAPLPPAPATTALLPPPPVNIPAPVMTVPPSPPPATVETTTPPPPKPRLPRLHDLFPRLFPNG